MTKNKTFKVDVIISEYNQNDEGFYIIKANAEVAKGPEQLVESFDILVSNGKDYIERRLI